LVRDQIMGQLRRGDSFVWKRLVDFLEDVYEHNLGNVLSLSFVLDDAESNTEYKPLISINDYSQGIVVAGNQLPSEVRVAYIAEFAPRYPSVARITIFFGHTDHLEDKQQPQSPGGKDYIIRRTDERR
jgi:hypothetical protein